MKKIETIKTTVGEHHVRNLEFVNENTLTGEVLGKYLDVDIDTWEKITWKRDNKIDTYYSSSLGSEWWDICLDDE